jgi:hypothetical protein
MKQKALFILGITGIVFAMAFASCNNDPEGSVQDSDDDVQKLINTIADADKAMENVRGSFDGRDVSKSGYWVTPDVWDDIVRAKISANAALQEQPRDIEEIKRLYRTLSVALDTFNKDKQPGTGPAQRSVKIDGLNFDDGTSIALELYEDFNGTMPRGVTGSGQIQNKTVTVPLYSTGMVEPPGIWNSSGGWLFAVLRVNTTPSQTYISEDVLRFAIIVNDNDSVVPVLFSAFKPFVFRYEVRDFTEQAVAVTEAGISMDDWCKKLTGTDTVEIPGKTYGQLGLKLYKNEARTQEFSGSDLLKPETAIYCDFDLMARRWQIGAITGTITLIGADPALEVYIYAYAREEFRSWDTVNDKALLQYSNNGWTWEIPIYKDTGFFPTNGGASAGNDKENYYGTYFTLFVQPTGKSGFRIDIPTVTPAVMTGSPPIIEKGTRGVGTPRETTNVGSLGSVNLNPITLSGTLTVTYKGQAVQYVQIKAFINDLTPYGTSESYAQPGANVGWSIELDGPINPGMVATQVPVSFEVSGYQDSALTNLLFTEKFRETNNEIFVIGVTGESNVTGITIDMGNVN